MSYTRYNFIDWNNLTANNVNDMQKNTKQVIYDFLQHLLNIGFGRGGWKNITYAVNGPTAVNVVFGTWAFLVQHGMLATPAAGTKTVTGFTATSTGERTDIIVARVYELEDRTKIPYTVYQEVELRRVESGAIDEFGWVWIGNVGYLALARVRVGTEGIISVVPFKNEPRIDTRNVDGRYLINGDRENLWEALKALENMINSINVGGDGDGSGDSPIDLSPYVKKKSFGMLTGTITPAKTITWSITGLFPNHTPIIIGCEVSQIVIIDGIQRKIYRPYKDWFSYSYIETWEATGKGATDDPPGDKVVWHLNGADRGQGVYVRVFLLHEDGVYDITAASSVPRNLRESFYTA